MCATAIRVFVAQRMQGVHVTVSPQLTAGVFFVVVFFFLVGALRSRLSASWDKVFRYFQNKLSYHLLTDVSGLQVEHGQIVTKSVASSACPDSTTQCKFTGFSQ